MVKSFASATNMAKKKVTFFEVGADLYSFTAEGSLIPLSFSNDSCLVFDAQVVPAMAYENDRAGAHHYRQAD